MPLDDDKEGDGDDDNDDGESMMMTIIKTHLFGNKCPSAYQFDGTIE